LTAEGATREEAVAQLRQAWQSRLQSGVEMALVDLALPAHPLAAYAGRFHDNPLLDAWQQAVAAYRQQAEDVEGP
jgi:hypothetical protein